MFLLPTRERPENLDRFLRCYSDTRAESPITILLDECDRFLGDYLTLSFPENVSYELAERVKPAQRMNNFVSKNRDLDWYGILADDVIPLTVFWDRILVSRAGKNKIAYPNDLIQKENLCTHPVVGGDIVRDLGFLIFPGVKHYFGDNVLHVVGQCIDGLEYCEDVILRHEHNIITGIKDGVTMQLETSYTEDEAAFKAWVDLPETRSKLISMRVKYARG